MCYVCFSKEKKFYIVEIDTWLVIKMRQLWCDVAGLQKVFTSRERVVVSIELCSI